jgi:hypothetical protein
MADNQLTQIPQSPPEKRGIYWLATFVLILVGEVACAPVITRDPVTTPVAGAQGGAPSDLTCGSLGPSTDSDAIARVGALFSRPENVTQLLQNLKLAYDKDLLLEPGFYDAANLAKFFAGTTVTWNEPRGILPTEPSVQDIVVTSDGKVLPHITIELRRTCWLEVRFEAPNRYLPDHVKEAGAVALQVGDAPGFTLGVVKGVFGPPSTQGMNYGYVDDGPGVVPTNKGSLIYRDRDKETRAGSEIETAKVTFVVKLDPPATSDAQRQLQAVLNDSDSLDEIWLHEVRR